MARRNKQQATLEQILAAIKEGQNQTPKQDPAALAKREKSLQREIEMLEHKEKLIVKGNSSAEKSLALAKAQLAINRKREQKELASIQRRKELGELEGDELKRAYERLDAMEDDHDADEKKIIDDEKKIETKKELIDTIEKEIAAIAGVSKSMSGQIAIYGKHRMVSTDALMGLMKSIKQNGILQSVMGAGIGIMTGFIDTTIALAFSVDEARASLMKTTGVTRDFATAMTSDVQEMSKFLVSAEDMNATLGALIPTFTDFTNLNKAQQREIRQTGDLLAKGGVSLEDYGQNLQMLTKGMALGPETAAAFSREMSSLATAIGVTPQQMAKDFAGVSGSLMKLGSEGPKAFKALALASKATGLEVSKLLQITDKFDTFEGAAEQAGRLNAALGGNFVNAMDLMMDTDPVGRLNQIRDAILNTGLTFDDMGYMQRKFYAEAAGMENTADLALLLSGDLDALKESSRESSDSILALQQRTKAMQSIQEKFKALLMSLIPVFEPLITQLHDLVNTLDRDDVVEKISAAFVSLGEAFRWVQKWGEPVLWTLGTLFVGKYALGFILFLKNMGVLGALAPKVGAGLGLANISFLEFAAAVVLVGAGIALAAYGLSFLVKSFGEIGDNAGYAVGGF